MQNNIIKKVLDALNEKEPNISYIKGMLETLLEMSGMPIPEIKKEIPRNIYSSKGIINADEAVDEVLSKYEKGTTGKLS